MCGRYTFVDTKGLKKRFKLVNEVEGLTPRYNAAPGQMMPVIIEKDGPAAVLMRWGLVPQWAKDPKIGYRMINARAESLPTKPAWRGPFLHSRCLVPASGFFEWQHRNGKQPYYITVKQEALFAIAGLYDQWLDAEDHPLYTFTIITTRANTVVRQLHDRMPVILHKQDEPIWLNPTNHDAKSLERLLQPFESDQLVTYPVSGLVNNPKNDEQSILDKAQLE